MSDTRPTLEPSAGRLLREAREQRGIALPVLAASLKLPVHKLEALEADRYAELTDATFVRALALSMCRHLRIDAEPVLELLPAGDAPTLKSAQSMVRMRRGDSPRVAFHPVPWIRRPVTWLVLTLLAVVAALAAWWPQVVAPRASGASQSVTPPSAVPSAAPVAGPQMVVTPVPAAAAAPGAASAGSDAAMLPGSSPNALPGGTPATSAPQQATMPPVPAR